MKDFKLIFSYLRKAKGAFVMAVLTIIIETAFELVIPVIMAKMIDVGVANHDMNYIIVTGAMIGGCALMSLVNGLLYAHFGAIAFARFGATIREAQFAKIQTYSFTNIDHFEPSSLLTRVINDSLVMQNVLSNGLRPIIRGPIMLVLGIVLSVIISPSLSLIFLVLTPILAAIIYFILRNVNPRYILLQKQLDKLNEKIQENLIAIRSVKAFVRKPYECQAFDQANSRYRNIVEKTFRIATLNLPLMQTSMYLGTVLFMWFGGSMIVAGSLDVGGLTAILSYVMQTFNSLVMISNVFVLLAKSLASVYRISEVLNEKPTMTEGHDAEEITQGALVFDHVSFRYAEKAKENVLSDISLSVLPGKTLGIIGPTGSAKSTLASLMLRLYDASEGEVLIDGHDVKDYRSEILRERIAMVFQKSTLFSGTIRENLAWGDPHPTDDALAEALRISCVDEFLPRLDRGLDTEVGEGGNAVSGGQKQRICLARALLKKPKILILDDATSAVDTATEKKIRSGLESLSGMTKIIISQRLLSVMDADEIIILEDGRIVDRGSPDELMLRSKIYQDLYEAQLKGATSHE